MIAKPLPPGCRGLGLGAVLLALSVVAAQAEVRWPFAAVGRLGTEVKYGCSATLIAPDLVLSAAHCAEAIARNPGRHFFETGAYPGLPAVSVPITAAATHPIYLPSRANDLRWLRFDLAVIRLERPVSEPGIAPINVGAGPEVGERLFLAGYRGGQGPRARERRCEIFADVGEAYALGCEVRSGESGSPLIRRTESGFVIAGLLTSRTQADQQPIGLAVSVAERLDVVLDALPTP